MYICAERREVSATKPKFVAVVDGALISLVFEHRFDLLAQFRCILVAVRRDRMLYRCIEHFPFCTRNFQRAIFLTRMISAIDRFSIRHVNLLLFPGFLSKAASS